MTSIERCPENATKQFIVPITSHPINPAFPTQIKKLLKEYEDRRPYRWMMVLTEPLVKNSKNPDIQELRRILAPTVERAIGLARADYEKRYPKPCGRLLRSSPRGKSYAAIMVKNPKDLPDLRQLREQQDPHGDTFREYKKTGKGKPMTREVAFTLTSFAKSEMHISAAQRIDDALTAPNRLLILERGWTTTFTTEAIHWGILGCPPTAVLHCAYWKIGPYNPRDFGPMLHLRSAAECVGILPHTIIPKQAFLDALKIDFNIQPSTDLSPKQLQKLLVKVSEMHLQVQKKECTVHVAGSNQQ